MYDLQPAAAALHQGSLNAFTSITGLLLDAGARTLDICSAARQDLLAAPRQPGEQTTDALHRHSLALTREAMGALMALQEETLRFYEGHSHGLNAFIAHSLEKAGKATPAEILPAMELFQKSVSNLDSAMANISKATAQTAAKLESNLLQETVAAAPAAKPKAPAARRKSVA